MASAQEQAEAEAEAQPATSQDRGQFRAWFQTHERLVLIVGAIAALATLAIWWRGRNSSATPSSTPGAGGIPTASVTDSTTSQALDSLTQAISNLMANLPGNNAGAGSSPGSTSGSGTGTPAPGPGPLPAGTGTGGPAGSGTGTTSAIGSVPIIQGASPLAGSAGSSSVNGGLSGIGITPVGGILGGALTGAQGRQSPLGAGPPAPGAETNAPAPTGPQVQAPLPGQFGRKGGTAGGQGVTPPPPAPFGGGTPAGGNLGRTQFVLSPIGGGLGPIAPVNQGVPPWQPGPGSTTGVTGTPIPIGGGLHGSPPWQPGPGVGSGAAGGPLLAAQRQPPPFQPGPGSGFASGVTSGVGPIPIGQGGGSPPWQPGPGQPPSGGGGTRGRFPWQRGPAAPGAETNAPAPTGPQVTPPAGRPTR